MSAARGRYPSDLSDVEWLLIEPLLPPVRSGPKGGRPGAPRRDVVDAIFYVVRSGCAWRQLPVDFPPWQTVYHHFNLWSRDGTMQRIHAALVEGVRRFERGRAEPTAGIVDAQSIRAADTVGALTRGYDAGKKTAGRKRHIIVDTTGLLLAVVVSAASVQDRDGARIVTDTAVGRYPTLRRLWADSGYRGRFVDWAATTYNLAIEIVAKRDGQIGFEVLPRRWCVERTFAWITKCRRANADYERLPRTSEAVICWAMIGLMTRRLARHVPGHTVTPYGWTK